MRRRLLYNEKILSVVRRWLAPQSVNSSDCICQACWDLTKNPQADDQERPLGHCHVCVHDGCFLASKDKLLHTNSTCEEKIYNVIQEWIAPLNIQATSHIFCHKCWVKPGRAAARMNLQVIQPTHQRIFQNEGVMACQAIQLTDQSVPRNEGVIRKQAEPTKVVKGSWMSSKITMYRKTFPTYITFKRHRSISQMLLAYVTMYKV